MVDIIHKLLHYNHAEIKSIFEVLDMDDIGKLHKHALPVNYRFTALPGEDVSVYKPMLEEFKIPVAKLAFS